MVQRSRFRRNMGIWMLAAAVLLVFSFHRPVMAEAEEKKSLTITVVEDMPAVEIEEMEVPLAAMPETPGSSGVRHAVWMGILLAAAAAYVFYFSHYDRKLLRLRREASRAEQEMVKKYREKNKQKR